MTETLVHAGIVALGIVAYVILTAVGKDGNPVLAAALAWGSGAAAQAGLTKRGTV